MSGYDTRTLQTTSRHTRTIATGNAENTQMTIASVKERLPIAYARSAVNPMWSKSQRAPENICVGAYRLKQHGKAG